MAGKTVGNAMNNITDDGAAGRSDDADGVGQKRDFLFMCLVKQSFGGKFLFAFFQQFEQGAGAGDFQAVNDQLVR